MAPSDDRVRTERIRLGDQAAIRLEVEALRMAVTEGPDAGLRLELDAPVVRIGSGDACDLRLTDPAVSRQHAEVRVEPDGFHVVDLDSTNGLRINGAETCEARLAEDFELELGASRIQFSRKVAQRTAVIGDAPGLGPLVGQSPAMRELYAMLQAVAPTTATVLLRGETGTGKELAARAVHDLSGRSGEFVAFDSTSCRGDLVGSMLFGHAKGAFSGAVKERKGAFVTANNGTLFIDEVGEIPLEHQALLLRALESRAVQAVGTDRPVPVDVRLVAATHRDLTAMVHEGTFRRDLFHRIAVFAVDIPALRDRLGDLDLLVAKLAEDLPARPVFTDEACARLRAYAWPGNVRELRNLIERIVILRGENPVRAQDVQFMEAPGEVARLGPTSLATDGDPPPIGEHGEILDALRRNKWNRARTAEEIGISTVTLWRRMKKYGIEG